MGIDETIRSIQWQRDGSLYIPGHAAPPSLRYIGLRPSHKDIFGRELPEHELRQRVAGLSRSAAVIVLGRLMLRTHWGAPSDPRFQQQVVGEIFGGVAASAVKRWLEGKSVASVIDPHCAMALAKLVLLESPEGGFGRQELEHAWAETPGLLLAAGDAVSAHIEEARSGLSEEEEADYLLDYLVQGMAFTSRPWYYNEAGRYGRMFLHLCRRKEARDSPDWMDIASAFNDVSGHDLEAYLACGFALVASLTGTGQRVEPLRSCIRRRQWLRGIPGATGRATMDSVIAALSRPACRFARAFRQRTGVPFYYDFAALEQTPLIRLPGGRVCCIYPTWLEEAVTAGVYWRLHGGLDEHRRQRFCRFVGKLLELHVEELFRSCLPVRCLFRAHQLRKRPAADIVYFEGNDAFFLELATSRLKKTGVQIEARHDVVEADLAELAEEAKQATASADQFLSGRAAYAGHPAGRAERCWPIVVSLHHVPVDRFTLKRLRDKVAGGGKSSRRIRAPLFVDVGELEALCRAIEDGRSFGSLIREWASDREHAEWPLRNFLIAAGLGMRTPALVRVEAERLGERAKAILGGDAASEEATDQERFEGSR